MGVAMVVVLASCGAPSGREVRSGAGAAEPDPVTLDGGVAAVNSFAIDLEKAVSHRGGNIALAPYPIARSLAMARLGTRGDTRAALDRVLHADLSKDLDLSFTTIDATLRTRSGDQRSSTRKGKVDLSMPSELWQQEETSFTPEYIDALARYYDTGVRVVDFRSEPDAARNAMNRWAAAETDGVIDLLVPRGEVSDFTRFVAASAGSLHAPWAVRFEPTATRNAPFALEDGRTVGTATMSAHGDGTIRSTAGAGYQAVELPYLGGGLAMLIVAPDAGTFDDYAARFDRTEFQSVVDGLAPRAIELDMPRFQFTSVLTLDDELSAMGLGDAFSPERADFSGITDDETLAISDVVGGTYVAADEEGSDGEAATVVPSTGGSTAAAPIVAIDRPFLFVVRDTVTGLILQIGRVLEPQP